MTGACPRASKHARFATVSAGSVQPPFERWTCAVLFATQAEAERREDTYFLQMRFRRAASGPQGAVRPVKKDSATKPEAARPSLSRQLKDFSRRDASACVGLDHRERSKHNRVPKRRSLCLCMFRSRIGKRGELVAGRE